MSIIAGHCQHRHITTTSRADPTDFLDCLRSTALGARLLNDLAADLPSAA